MNFFFFFFTERNLMNVIARNLSKIAINLPLYASLDVNQLTDREGMRMKNVL